MKIGIIIGILLFSFDLRAEIGMGETFAARQISQGMAIYKQAKKQVAKLERILKEKNLFKKAEFERFEQLIKSNDIALALRILEKYRLKGERGLDKVATRLYKRLRVLARKRKASIVQPQQQDENCPGSGSEQTELFSTERAFAALQTSGLVITWGDSSFGGDSSDAADDIACGVVKIVSTQSAFAALKFDGSVVTWGDANGGGDSSSVATKLADGVSEIVSSQKAFAAIKTDGSLVVWGDRYQGGEAAIMREHYLQDGWEAFPLHESLFNGSHGRVIKVVATRYAFAAILQKKKDPSKKVVFAWGDELHGGDLAIHRATALSYSESIVSSKMKEIGPLLGDDVVDIVSTETAFAARKADGSVVTWGGRIDGGDSSYVSSQLQDGVSKIFSNKTAFAALKSDGSVVPWGARSYGGDASVVASKLRSGVRNIVTNDTSMVAIKEDGSVVGWGFRHNSNNSHGSYRKFHNLQGGSLQGVTHVIASSDSYAAIKSDGSVSTWGNIAMGGNLMEYALGREVVSIVANDYTFAAIKRDGGVVSWGRSEFGGSVPVSQYHIYRDAEYEAYAAAKREGREVDPEQLKRELIHHIYRIKDGVVKVAATKAAFAALKTDGTIVTWGADGYGADSSSVASLFEGN